MVAAWALGVAGGSCLCLASPAKESASVVPTLPKEFADAPGVVLEDVQVWTLGQAEVRETVHKRILLLTREAFDLADQGVFYEASDSRILHFEAHTVRADGS